MGRYIRNEKSILISIFILGNKVINLKISFVFKRVYISAKIYTSIIFVCFNTIFLILTT